MKITTFAAIYIGSYEVSLKIFELSAKKPIREIDHVRARVELGKESYQKGYIGYELMEELGNVLAEYKKIDSPKHRTYIYKPICVKSKKIDGKFIKENTYYKLENKKFVEVEDDND